MRTAEEYKNLTISEFTKAAGLKVEKLASAKKWRMHLVARK